ncbi:hypothetical protein [Salinarimonas sp.]|uniref:ImuA family protein n=1 Tax=Salinarimonas sp. TaxID=2766526 RepID=UPI0032D97371
MAPQHGGPGDGAPRAPADAEALPERLERARAALRAALAAQGGDAPEDAFSDGTFEGGFSEPAQAAYAAEAGDGSAPAPPPPRRRRPRPVPLGAPGLDAVLGGGLARGTIHEILAAEAGDLGAAHGFASALAARLARRGENRSAGRVLLVQDEASAREDGAPYAPGLAMHGLDPERLVLVRAKDAREALWATEQALLCRSLAAVIAEIARLPGGIYDLTASRRLVLAAREGGGAARGGGAPTGLIVQAAAGARGTVLASAAETRWIVSAAPSRPGLAGEPGAPAWRAWLARHRGGREGLFHLEWSHDDRAFRDAPERAAEPRAREALPGPRPADARDRSGAPGGAGGTGGTGGAGPRLLPFARRA